MKTKEDHANRVKDAFQELVRATEGARSAGLQVDFYHSDADGIYIDKRTEVYISQTVMY